MKSIMIWWILSLGAYNLLEILLRDKVPVIARSSDTWQSWAFPVIVSVVVIAFCELISMRKSR
ncbi:hypothetical protein EGO53_27940 (plasmid) [Serratia liquefaciens]|uniref:Uncharacterized protein n=1 Tax=Serratia liquefaciens TaxID=614 RepID=A0A515D5F8_SERLI|nr:hypothetical protein EGO53_27940 [Serratia liquefaciens]